MREAKEQLLQVLVFFPFFALERRRRRRAVLRRSHYRSGAECRPVDRRRYNGVGAGLLEGGAAQALCLFFGK